MKLLYPVIVEGKNNTETTLSLMGQRICIKLTIAQIGAKMQDY